MCRLRAYAKYSRESVLGTGKSCQVATRSVTSKEKPVSAVQKATQWIRCPFVTTFHLAPRPRITLGGHIIHPVAFVRLVQVVALWKARRDAVGRLSLVADASSGAVIKRYEGGR